MKQRRYFWDRFNEPKEGLFGEEQGMKHEKEWYTCDRCGEEIKEDIHAWSGFMQRILKRYKVPEYMQMI